MHCLRRISTTITQASKYYGRTFLTLDGITGAQDPNKRILIDKFSAITLIGLNRPEKKNSLTTAMTEELCQAFEEFDKDDSSSVCVLYGTGGNLCAGYDLEEISNFDGENIGKVPQFSSLANKRDLSSKIVIAAVSGYTLGAGLELALMCDLRIVEDSAVMGFFNRRFGIPILSGGTVRLPTMIGYSRAMDMIVTGRRINAKEALEWGLGNRATAIGTATGVALKLALAIDKFPRKTVLADRASLRFAVLEAKTIDEALQFEKDASSHLLFEEGVNQAKRFYTEGTGRHGSFRISNNVFEPEGLKEELL